MTKTELKDKLISKISELEDQRLLEDIFRIVDMETEISSTYKLSAPEQSAVREGITQLDGGQSISNEDLNTKINKWLGE